MTTVDVMMSERPPSTHATVRHLRPVTEIELTAPIDVERAYLDLAPAVLGYLRAQSVDEPEDLLGEIFLQVVRDLDRFRGSTNDFRRWLFTIAHNRVVDHHRRRRRRPTSFPLADDTEAIGQDDIESMVTDPVLIDALGRLTDDQRDVLVLRFIADLSIADVAQIMRRRTGAVKALQQRALSSLAARLEA